MKQLSTLKNFSVAGTAKSTLNGKAAGFKILPDLLKTFCLAITIFGFQNILFSQSAKPWANWHEDTLGVKPAWAFGKDDTLHINETNNPPTIDGLETDPCWTSPAWHKMNYSWLESQDKIFHNHDTILTSPSVFSVRYKMTWSSSTNKIYFLLERTDDTIVQGYNPKYNSDNDSSYTNFDFVEVFTTAGPPVRTYDTTMSLTSNDQVINPRPMHDHTFNNGSYAFHMDGSTTAGASHVMDEPVCKAWDTPTAWTCWSLAPAEYTSYFNIAIARQGSTHTYVWEFSMDLLDSLTSPVSLTTGKVIGFAIASGNINKINVGRQLFAANIWLPPDRRNDSWMDATEFGTLSLDKSLPTLIPSSSGEGTFKVYPNPVSDYVNFSLPSGLAQKVTVKIYSLLGEPVFSDVFNTEDIKLNVSGLLPGVYFLQVSSGGTNVCK